MTMRVALVVPVLWAFFSGIVLAAPAPERMELDVTAILGARELPRVLYIVPWKNSRLGSLAAGGSGSFEESMVALDRAVFRRQVQYHQLLPAATPVSRN